MSEVETQVADDAATQRIENSVVRTAELFALTKRNTSVGYDFAPSKKVRMYTKLQATYVDLPESLLETSAPNAISDAAAATTTKEANEETSAVVDEESALVKEVAQEVQAKRTSSAISSIRPSASAGPSSAVVTYKEASSAFHPPAAGATQWGSGTTGALVRRRATPVPKPKWHAPWMLKRVIAGHLGWVRSVAVDPTNQWFATGSADRTIKIWDLASGQLKLTLTGHINSIRGLVVSPRHPYLFSAGEDKKVLCWDLECNKVIRSYHGHLSGVFCLKMHPTLDILISGGRDAVARVWDMRTKNQIHCLGGHEGTLWDLETQAVDPQIITGSSDSTVKLWDLAAGKVMTTLTNHKKSIRALALSPIDHTFVSGAADNIKKWEAKKGQFMRNFAGHNAILNTLSINQDSVLMSGGDNGSMRFWDYSTGYCFQQEQTKIQPGSLDSEAGIYASSFDNTGLRLITCEADKTIKVWQEDPEASEESHPIDMAAWSKICSAPKRY